MSATGIVTLLAFLRLAPGLAMIGLATAAAQGGEVFRADSGALIRSDAVLICIKFLSLYSLAAELAVMGLVGACLSVVISSSVMAFTYSSSQVSKGIAVLTMIVRIGAYWISISLLGDREKIATLFPPVPTPFASVVGVRRRRIGCTVLSFCILFRLAVTIKGYTIFF